MSPQASLQPEGQSQYPLLAWAQCKAAHSAQPARQKTPRPLHLRSSFFMGFWLPWRRPYLRGVLMEERRPYLRGVLMEERRPHLWGVLMEERRPHLWGVLMEESATP